MKLSSRFYTYIYVIMLHEEKLLLFIFYLNF